MNKPECIMIVAQTNNRVIGRNNGMPWHLPKDLQWFKRHTEHHPVIMGRNTFESIGRALPNRRNIVITSADEDAYPDAEVMRSLDETLYLLRNEPKIFIIGGAALYHSAIAIADTLIVTHIDTTIDDGDRFFPVIDPSIWDCTSEEHAAADSNNPFGLRFCVYHRKIG